MRELEFLINLLNRLPEMELEINCTFLVGGRIIEGELIPARQYYRLLGERLRRAGPFTNDAERSVVGAMVTIFDNFAGIAFNIENPRETPSLNEEDIMDVYLQRAVIRGEKAGEEDQQLGLFHLKPLAVQGFRLGSSRSLR
ncbi:MAG TPA: hypothetical protein VH186_30560 [Chloroflexia bacterium]|nr:hypothetical protein [Chloroflexia bacterium]